jgi:hypothetical protein
MKEWAARVKKSLITFTAMNVQYLDLGCFLNLT